MLLGYFCVCLKGAITMEKKTIITYRPTNSKFPIWKEGRKVHSICWAFKSVDPKTGEFIGDTKLWWRRDTDDHFNEDIYHGCSYMFTGYNPTPVTGWFHGVPRDKMLDWCEANNLMFVDCICEYISIEYVDVSYEATHLNF